MDVAPKALTPPPPLAVSDHSYFMQVFFTCINIYMFLKQERPEMDDFEEKISRKISIFEDNIGF